MGVLRFVATVLLLALAPVLSARAQAEVSREDFKLYMEVQEYLPNERLQALPEEKRIPELARRNFKMKPADLQAALDRVEAAGGPKAIAERSSTAIREALSKVSFAARVTDVRVDTDSAHVVAYVTWTVDEARTVDQEAVLLALKAAQAAPMASTVFLWGRDKAGGNVLRAKISGDATTRIREERIADWATTRYMRLFEVELASTSGSSSGTPTAIQ